MTKIRCSKCGGSGKERCEVHGSHSCSKCNGSGCVQSNWATSDPWKQSPYKINGWRES